MSKVTVQKFHDRMEVPAVYRWDAPGLAVTPHIDERSGNPVPRLYSITHVPSGHAVGHWVLPLDEAVTLMRMIGDWMDWTMNLERATRAAQGWDPPGRFRLDEAVAEIVLARKEKVNGETD